MISVATPFVQDIRIPSMATRADYSDFVSSSKSRLRELIAAETHCKYKSHLQLQGEVGEKLEYELLCQEKCEEVRARSVKKIVESFPEPDVIMEAVITPELLRTGPKFILDGTMPTELGTLHFDGLQRKAGHSLLGAFYYVPILFLDGKQARSVDKVYLEICSRLLSSIQERVVDRAAVYYGHLPRLTTIRLTEDLRNGDALWTRLRQREIGNSSPPLILNAHCQRCEYQSKCETQAIADDNLSLLRGITQKKLEKYSNKGIFTLTQLAYTFRPRRKAKRSLQKTPHYHALKAMAIRDSTLYVFDKPVLVQPAVRVYLDIEGNSSGSNIYLVGMIITDGAWEREYSFWADEADQELAIFEQFVRALEPYADFVVFTYGAYEIKYLKRMRKLVKSKASVDRVLDRVVNVLSLIYSHFYFPSYSNGLKSIGRLLGYSWSNDQASGLQSLVWRARWEATRNDEFKRKLCEYNRDDCAALRRVTECLSQVLNNDDQNSQYLLSNGNELAVSEVRKNGEAEYEWAWGNISFAHPDFEFVNKCAYFSYQRQRVYVRNNKWIKREVKSRRKRVNKSLKISQHIHHGALKCPACKRKTSVAIIAKERETDCPVPRTKRAYDLAFTPSSARRKVLGFHTTVHRCTSCGHEFVPEKHSRLDRHFHGLKSFVIYLHVEHRLSLGIAAKIVEELFGMRLHRSDIYMFKSLMANFYGVTYRRILGSLLTGGLLHADETDAPIKGKSGYVWTFTNMEHVYFTYRPNREGQFLKELLQSFEGVLVSDFYAAYDSMDCEQQKCLVHLIRDMNQSILSAPYDTELRLITEPFGVLLRSIVETIDEHGLKRRAMRHHVVKVDAYFQHLRESSFDSQPATLLQKRLITYQDKLFTFIRHDGIPWNNNNAEWAIKRYADYRSRTRGKLQEKGSSDYLVLLSICETCRYKGISFLKFMLSRKKDIDAFRNRKKTHTPRTPTLQIYPKGFVSPLSSLRKRFGEEATP
jgi:predicted RecB family nuclease